MVVSTGCQILSHPLVLDPDHFDPDPAFQFDMDPDPTVLSGSGSLLFQRGNVPKTVLFIHFNLTFLVSRSARTQPAGIVD